jgi:hypothetical protein
VDANIVEIYNDLASKVFAIEVDNIRAIHDSPYKNLLQRFR